jgi:hypothetical protein
VLSLFTSTVSAFDRAHSLPALSIESVVIPPAEGGNVEDVSG